MAFFGDYHTHTVYSHGKSTIEENVEAAKEKGLKEIAITDHGFKHMMYHVRRMDWPYMQKEIAEIRQKHKDIKIHLGIETNFNSLKGHIDLLTSEVAELDIVVCGYHFMVMPDRISDFFKMWVPNFFQQITKRSSKRAFIRNTDMYLKALEKYEIDILSHPNYGIKIDVVEVAKACKHYKTYFELNGRKVSISDETLGKVIETGVEFIVNSDAHRIRDVGNFDLPMATIERVGLPLSQVANWERFPKFRSRKSTAKDTHMGFLGLQKM